MVGRYIKPILIGTGIITASMIAAFFAPAVVLDQLFADAPSDAGQPRPHAALGPARVLLRRTADVCRLLSELAIRCLEVFTCREVALVLGILLVAVGRSSSAAYVAAAYRCRLQRALSALSRRTLKDIVHAASISALRRRPLLARFSSRYRAVVSATGAGRGRRHRSAAVVERGAPPSSPLSTT